MGRSPAGAGAHRRLRLAAGRRHPSGQGDPAGATRGRRRPGRDRRRRDDAERVSIIIGPAGVRRHRRGRR
ncbi:MAG: hypothetical protein FGM58_00860 [Acidimicrobiia bacterium]|nr:hypothetical protein [Acidimicrobiia bacterium]